MKRLVVAPHVDDDVLGCGGILDAETVTLYVGVDQYHNGANFAVRHMEAAAVAERTGGRYWWPACAWDERAIQTIDSTVRRKGCIYIEDHNFTQRVNGYSVAGTIPLLEHVIMVEKPGEVYIPWPSYNQDHRAVYEAALVALRPHDRNHFVPRVLVYEGSQINFWDHATPGVQFQPNYFVPIDIDRKLALYACMPSQIRQFRSGRQLVALATLRGGEIGVDNAEAFQILRWVGER